MKTRLFAEEFPGRYLNLGIAEQNAVSLASGLARRGLVPLLHTFSNFIARRAHDQVALSVAWPGCNVKLIGGSCGLFDGRNGPSHMATDDLSVMAGLPGVMIAEPGDLRQTRELLGRLVRHNGPAYLRLRRYGADLDLLPDADYATGTVLIARNDLALCTLVACGTMLAETRLAADMLRDKGVPLDLAHVSVLKPLHVDVIADSAKRTRRIVTVENHVLSGGFGDAIARAVGHTGFPHLRLGLPDEFIPAGDPAWQLAFCGLDAVSLAEHVSHFVHRGEHV